LLSIHHINIISMPNHPPLVPVFSWKIRSLSQTEREKFALICPLLPFVLRSPLVFIFLLYLYLYLYFFCIYICIYFVFVFVFVFILDHWVRRRQREKFAPICPLLAFVLRSPLVFAFDYSGFCNLVDFCICVCVFLYISILTLTAVLPLLLFCICICILYLYLYLYSLPPFVYH